MERVLLGMDVPVDRLETPSAPTARFDPRRLPSVFGPYLIHREIAVGGMGIVYEAEDRALRRRVALKMIRSIFFARDTDRARFRAEAEAAARLEHAHIVPVYEVGEVEGHPYFTMKLMAGGSLSDRLHEPGQRLEPREAARLLLAIARAVQHAHERGVLHRDLKPANILFDADGNPQLADFGLAKLLHLDSGLTLSQAQLGTPQYMSPEQAAGRHRDLSTASDVWSLGVVLYQALTGRLPFPGQSPAEVLRRISESEPVPPASLKEGIDRDLETLCLRCLDKDPSRRLAGAGALADDLARWLRGEPIQARPVGPLEVLTKAIRRKPALSALAGLAVASLAVGTTGMAWQWRNALLARDEARNSALVARENLYFATIANAVDQRRQNDLARGRQLLESLRPAEFGEPDLRGLEWRLLHWLCAGDPHRELPRAPGDGTPTSGILWTDTHLLVARTSGRLELRDPRDLTVQREITLEETPTSGPAVAPRLALSPDGRHLAVAREESLYVADLATGRPVFRQNLRRPTAVWLGPGEMAFGESSGYPGQHLWRHRLPDPAPVPWPGETGAPLDVTPDGEWLASVRYDPAAVTLWRPRDDLPARTWPVPFPGEVSLIRFSPQGREVAVTLRNHHEKSANHVVVFDASTGRPLFSHRHRFPVRQLAFHPSEPLLVVSDGSPDLRGYRYLQPVPPFESNTYDDFSAPESRVRIGLPEVMDPPARFLTRSAQEGRVLFVRTGLPEVDDFALSPSGNEILVAGRSRLGVWSMPPHPAGGTDVVGDVFSTRVGINPVVSEDATRVLYWSVAEHRTILLDRPSGRRLAVPGEALFPLALLPEDRFVLQNGINGEVSAWTRTHGQPVRLWATPGGAPGQNAFWVRGAQVTPDGRRLVGVQPTRIFTLELESGRLLAKRELRMEVGREEVAGFSLSPDGQWLAVTGFGPQTRLVSVETLETHPAQWPARGWETALAFIPGSGDLAVGREDGWIQVVNPRTGKIRAAWRAHTGPVIALAIDRDGRTLLSSGDRALCAWNIDNGRLRVSIPVDRPRVWMAIIGGGEVLAHVGEDLPLEFWSAPR